MAAPFFVINFIYNILKSYRYYCLKINITYVYIYPKIIYICTHVKTKQMKAKVKREVTTLIVAIVTGWFLAVIWIISLYL